MNLDLSKRMRRNRKSDWARRLVTETTLSPSDFIWPLFIQEGCNEKTPIPSMPGVYRYSIDLLVEQVKEAANYQLPMIALFPNTPQDLRDDKGSEALNPNNLVCRAIREIKSLGLNIGIMADVALDPYTSHGHDGLIIDGEIVNDATVKVLTQQSLILAQAGADCLGPSDMMDGRIGAIRQTLEQNKYYNTQIMSYAAKFASSYYGPFRDAVGASSTLQGDKKSYQMNPANSNEALQEVRLDIEEGADMVMIKPGLPYLDVLKNVKSTFNIPTFAYQVSGEYAMIQAAVENGWLEKEKIMMETLLSFKRAGADGVLTYFALDAAKYLLNKDAI